MGSSKPMLLPPAQGLRVNGSSVFASTEHLLGGCPQTKADMPRSVLSQPLLLHGQITHVTHKSTADCPSQVLYGEEMLRLISA